MAIVKPTGEDVSTKVASPVSFATSIQFQSPRSLLRGLTPFFFITGHWSLLETHLQVPDEYRTASRIGGKVPVVELQRSHTDLLFFNFYAGHGDRLQLTAASLLFERGWRFNIPNQVRSFELSAPLVKICLFQIWLARWPGITPTEKTPEWEEGLYQYFDHRFCCYNMFWTN